MCREKLVLIVIILALNANAAPKRVAAKKVGPSSTSGILLKNSGDVKEANEDELKSLRKGLQYLLQQEKPGPKRNQILLSDSSVCLALAKMYRLKANQSEEEKKYENFYLKKVLSNVQEISKSQFADLSAKSKAAYFSGLVYTYLGENNKAQKQFIDLLKFNPQFEYAPTISIFIAETYFEQEKYKDAIQNYTRYYKKLNDHQKAIAVYKMGWSYLNLQNTEMAKKEFIFLIGKKWSGSFAKDAIKDLAYVVTRELKSDEDIIAYSEKHFVTAPQIHQEFLNVVYNSYFTQSNTQRHHVLFNELYKLEKDPLKKLLLLINNLRLQQRSYASVEPLKDFDVLKKTMAEYGAKPGSKLFEGLSSELEVELQSLIRGYAETYSGKTKTPENIPKEKIGKTLIDLLGFYVDYFPQSSGKETTYDIWLTVCAQMSDHQCIYKISNTIIADKNLEKLKNKAWAELINSLGVLQEKDETKRTEYVEKLTEYSSNNKIDSQWLILTKRLTVVLNKDKKYDKSIPWLEKIFEAEKTSEAYFRLQWARFEAGLYQDVIDQQKNFPDKFGADAQLLVRESYLKLADTNIKKNDFKTYENNLKGFLASNPEEEKADLAKKDYFYRLIERNQVEELHAEFIKLSPSKRSNTHFKDIAIKLSDLLMQIGKFSQAIEVIDKTHINFYLCKFAMQSPLSKDEISLFYKQDQKSKSYLLGILALVKPHDLISYFKAHKPQIDEDKKLSEFATKMVEGNIKEDAITNVEKSYKNIVYTESKVKQSAEKVRALRPKVVKEMDAKNPKTQLRIVKSAIDSERKLADLILNSAMPKGLSEEQQKEYKTGIAELSKEFVVQADEYQKIYNAIEEKINLKKKEQGELLSKITMPGHDATKIIKQLMDSKNYLAAIILLDKVKGAEKISDLEYQNSRLSILKNADQRDVMQDYIASEIIRIKL